MPGRIIRDFILTDKAFNNLSLLEESIYNRLLVSVDDYGAFYADPVLLLRVLFPRRPEVNLENLREGLERLEELGFIRLYSAEGDDYLQICSWERDQNIKKKIHKYPLPEGTVENKPAEPAPRPEAISDTEPRVQELPVLELPLNDNTSYGVSQRDVLEYVTLFPAVDVAQELRNMRSWCIANPERRKTRKGVKRFISNWLTNAQNRSRASPSLARRSQPANPFLEMLKSDTEKNGNPDSAFHSGSGGGEYAQ